MDSSNPFNGKSFMRLALKKRKKYSKNILTNNEAEEFLLQIISKENY